MQQLITTNKASILAVLLPEDANTITPNGRELFYWVGNKPFVISLPDACYSKPLGFAKDLTEEHAETIMNEHPKYGWECAIKNDVQPYTSTALLALADHLKANKCYLENPYGKPDPIEYGMSNSMFENAIAETAYNQRLKLHEEAELRRGNWFILIEMKGVPA